MGFFFFGTLLDPELRALVIGRRLVDDLLWPAVLSGYQRYRVSGEAYPVLVPEAGAIVDGIVAKGLTVDDVARIVWYESDDYEIGTVFVTESDHTQIAANCFLRAPLARHDLIVWQYADWQQTDRNNALSLARQWMALQDSDDIEKAEQEYIARKRELATMRTQQ